MFSNVLHGVFGALILVLIATLLSSDRKKIEWKQALRGLVSIFFFAWLVMCTGPGKFVFEWIGCGLAVIIDYATEGTRFVFGPLYDGFAQIEGFRQWPYAFVLQALVPIVFFSALIKVLYYYGLMQWIVRRLARFFVKFFDISSVEAIVTASNVFLGQTQAPLTVSPYIEAMSRSQLFLMMVGGMATVGSGLLVAYAGMGAKMEYVLAASIMGAPAAIIFARIMEPGDSDAGTSLELQRQEANNHGVNVLDAVALGAFEGWKAVVGVTVMLLAFVALIHMIDGAIGWISRGALSLQDLLQYVFSPFAYIVGVPGEDVGTFARLVGAKTAFNEVIGFSSLATEKLSPKGFMLACFAMTGFANFSSIAIQVGTLGEIAPSRRSEVAALGARALLAATLANLASAAIAGVFFSG